MHVFTQPKHTFQLALERTKSNPVCVHSGNKCKILVSQYANATTDIIYVLLKGYHVEEVVHRYTCVCLCSTFFQSLFVTVSLWILFQVGKTTGFIKLHDEQILSLASFVSLASPPHTHTHHREVNIAARVLQEMQIST